MQFEFRVGKLSDADYQQTKLGLQKELAGVLAEIDRINPPHPHPAAVKAVAKPAMAAAEMVRVSNNEAAGDVSKFECPHCGAKFPRAMRFCGECGKVMA